MKRLAFAVGLFVTGTLNAALVDRGNGLIYDSDLDITWLQDANYALTSGYDADGLMTWQESMDWAAQLQFGGYSGWRLPIVDINEDHTVISCWDTTQTNLQDLCSDNELGYMYYYNLSGKHGDDLTGARGPFFNIQGNTIAGAYWSQDVFFWGSGDNDFDPDYFRTFDFGDGSQTSDFWNTKLHAWAVHDGDIGASIVPVPATIWLLGSGLITLLGLARSSRQHETPVVSQ